MATDSMPNVIEIGEIRNLSKTVSDKLQELIYTGKLKPGDRLVQTELAERFRVSRSRSGRAPGIRQKRPAFSNGQVGGWSSGDSPAMSPNIASYGRRRDQRSPLCARKHG